jgi:hypothetical protein
MTDINGTAPVRTAPLLNSVDLLPPEDRVHVRI